MVAVLLRFRAKMVAVPGGVVFGGEQLGFPVIFAESKFRELVTHLLPIFVRKIHVSFPQLRGACPMSANLFHIFWASWQIAINLWPSTGCKGIPYPFWFTPKPFRCTPKPFWNSGILGEPPEFLDHTLSPFRTSLPCLEAYYCTVPSHALSAYVFSCIPSKVSLEYSPLLGQYYIILYVLYLSHIFSLDSPLLV
jgi:hypothetical protein